jgi:hypothetical protein
MSKSKPTLSERIAAALVDDVQSSALAALIEEVEAATHAAVTAAEEARARALDPLVLDASARAALQDAEFLTERLQTALPRLRERHKEAAAEEYLAQWRKSYDELEIERDRLAAEMVEVYPAFVAKITDLFARIAAHDAELSRLHLARPVGVSHHLLGAELVARGLEAFSAAVPSIASQLQIPAFAPGHKPVWPPPRTPLALLLAAAMPVLPHPLAEWRSREERAAIQEAEQARLAAFYESQERAREERQAAEWEARQAQRRRSP